MANDNALITVDEFKAATGIESSTPAEDVTYANLIMAASEWMENYCETAFVKRVYVEYHKGGGKYLFLRRNPVVAVNMIVDPRGWRVQPIEYTIIPERAMLQHWGSFWTASTTQGAPTEWMVSYVAGRFDSVNQVTQDLKHACARLTDYLKVMPLAPGEASSVGVNGLSVSYVTGDDSGAFPFAVKQLLTPYRSGSSLVS